MHIFTSIQPNKCTCSLFSFQASSLKMREDAEAIEAALVAEIETIKVERSEVRLQGHQDKLTRTV